MTGGQACDLPICTSLSPHFQCNDHLGILYVRGATADKLLKLERDNNSKKMQRKVEEVTGNEKKSSSGTQCIEDELGNLLFEKD